MSEAMKNKPTVLIVEDDVTLNEAYKTILNMAEYNVCTAFNGEEALIVAEQNNPDIILLDLRMPVLDGIGFLKTYEPKKSHPDVQIVVFSNYDMQEEVDKAYSLGADRYILKARATPKELLKLVKDLS